MKTIRRGYHFILSPFIMGVAIVLFILDNLNVNVSGFSAYMLKDTQEA